MDHARQFRYWIVPAVLLIGLAPPVFSDATVPATQPADGALAHQLQHWVTQLGSDDPQSRQAALDRLMTLDRQDLPALRAAALAQSPLLPAQVAGLRDAVIQVFLAGDPYDFSTDPHFGLGFLGLSWQADVLAPLPNDALGALPNGVMVTERIPGFVGYRMLLPGDILVKILREPDEPDIELRGYQQFIDLVRPMRAGDVLRLEVLRHGRQIDLDIPLDHRPLKANVDVTIMQQWVNQRVQTAEDFWNEHFSEIDPRQTSATTQP
jgi:hypothetical protein